MKRRPALYRQHSFARLLQSLAIAFFISSCSDSSDTRPSPEPEAGEELSGGESLTTFDFSENAFGHEGNGLNSGQFTDFVVGNSLFRTNWVTAPASVQSLDGLGPMMNASSCGGCHFKDGRAEPGLGESGLQTGLLVRLSVPGEGPHGEPLAETNYGGQFQDRAIHNVVSEGSVKITYEEIQGTYEDGSAYSLRKPIYTLTLNYGPMETGTMMSPRIAQQIPGLGLLENISEENILALSDEEDKNQDGISGKPNYVWDQKLQQVVLGRFGWKANQPSLRQQVAGALNGDVGITTSLFSDDGLSTSQKETYKDVPNGGSPELEDEKLEQIVLYMQSLAVPGRRHHTDKQVLRGKQLFTEIQCSACHTPKHITANAHSLSYLNNQTIRPYTDLLLHDMGEGLADNRPDFKATGTEWRTPPLWGIGLLQTVNGHTTLLHDGRARNITEAILWHGGEAETANNKFNALPAADREALLKFLESL